MIFDCRGWLHGWLLSMDEPLPLRKRVRGGVREMPWKEPLAPVCQTSCVEPVSRCSPRFRLSEKLITLWGMRKFSLQEPLVGKRCQHHGTYIQDHRHHRHRSILKLYCKYIYVCVCENCETVESWYDDLEAFFVQPGSLTCCMKGLRELEEASIASFPGPHE